MKMHNRQTNGSSEKRQEASLPVSEEGGGGVRAARLCRTCAGFNVTFPIQQLGAAAAFISRSLQASSVTGLQPN